jgi:Cu(I)/Ag(I) efflux system membrane fusion protein
MKQFILAITVLAIGLALGTFFGPQLMQGTMSDGELSSADSSEKKPMYWVAPMDKNYRRDGPGLSPMGMDLVPVYEEDSGDDNTVKISATVENNLGVKVAKVKNEAIMVPIDTVGTIQFDESRISHIHPRVEGWIERLNVAASGDPVKQGQTLFELYSPELVNAQEEYLAALRSKNRNLIKASKSRLRSLGLRDSHINDLKKRRKVDQLVKFTAEQDGIVIDLKVREGMHIKPMTEVMSIGSLESVWVRGEVYERQAYLIQRGQGVAINLNSSPDRKWNGTINYIYPSLDQKTRTLQFRARVHNPDFALRPHMLANLRIENMAQDTMTTVPRSAVIKAGNHNRVVKSLGDGRYKSVIVELGLEGLVSTMKEGVEVMESKVQILKGLSNGDDVVVSAQFLIDSESNIEAELMRMEEAAMSQEMNGDMTGSAGPRVITSGTVHKVMGSMGMINVTHDPIPEWEWPTMKMDFQVSDQVDLSQFKEGEAIQFEIEKTGDWDYLVTRLATASEGLSAVTMMDMATMEMEMNHDHMSMDMSSNGEEEKVSVETSGKVKMLMLDMNMIEIVHEPIPEWSWPEMSMSFLVPEGEKLPEIKDGDELTFSLRENADGDYVMSNVRLK